MSEASDPIFARIAARYDRINRILSLGRERLWRASGVRLLEPGLILDMGSGTGMTDFEGRDVVGLDPVEEMLALSPVIKRVAGVGEILPFGDGVFDGVFSAFVVRNLTSVDQALEEAARVVRPGGAVVMVDLGRPVGGFKRLLHRLGTALTLPLIGLVFAGAPREYWYLHRTLDLHPQPEVLYGNGPLILEKTWRMGLFGFVYGVLLRKPPVE